MRVFTIDGAAEFGSSAIPSFGADADAPWFHRHPTLGLAVAIGGPLLLGLLVMPALTWFDKRRRT